MRLFCKSGQAYVLYPSNMEKDERITYLPIYMAGLLGEEEDNFDDLIIPAL